MTNHLKHGRVLVRQRMQHCRPTLLRPFPLILVETITPAKHSSILSQCQPSATTRQDSRPDQKANAITLTWLWVLVLTERSNACHKIKRRGPNIVTIDTRFSVTMKLFQIIVVAGSLLHPFVASADTTVTLRGAVQAASDEAAAIDADLGNHQRGSRDFCNSVCRSSSGGCFNDCRDNLKDFCKVSELNVGPFAHNPWLNAPANVRFQLLFATVRTNATASLTPASTTAATGSVASPEDGAAGADRRAAAATPGADRRATAATPGVDRRAAASTPGAATVARARGAARAARDRAGTLAAPTAVAASVAMPQKRRYSTCSTRPGASH